VLLAVATDPGYTRGVWAVEPTYFLACRIFDDAGLRVRGVPEGRGGVDIVALRERLREAERDRREALRGAVDQPVSDCAASTISQC
jgi:DNA-binding transcriptional MocR family regulator